MKHIEKGQVISLKNTIDYLEGGIANIDFVSGKEHKMMALAFDEGQGLKPHCAPGDALVIPLEGKAKVEVGEEAFNIEVGQQIVFPKGVTHSVTALSPYKMLLILSLVD
ncbi:cupin domain-containing protein [Aerococcus sp. UMB8608]|uniref:Cupin domain-containing protein n=1 Tax=Aerococcus sanguinicola TaxID=119206 RepID=A0A5N1GNF3_9LACT|nr:MULTISPECIES: cupin domain-containing protein [Aerococcus]KAA9301768.1 cupin domain-containing protein [Aerococcus sanguinicola]MDK6368816.1 cupin domain-containing protein [Aerococcus sp. UMB9870]MDK6679415.1 cupin domain-containing protein [Aerococcus sp. UMB8608]MDK6685741.1 cupin domain-containing protein [Aerococcus sp. UMB8623]MDK6939440.1 cupin domain-containing protein [Aerococcus sp. UMB8487]